MERVDVCVEGFLTQTYLRTSKLWTFWIAGRRGGDMHREKHRNIQCHTCVFKLPSSQICSVFDASMLTEQDFWSSEPMNKRSGKAVTDQEHFKDIRDGSAWR